MQDWKTPTVEAQPTGEVAIRNRADAFEQMAAQSADERALILAQRQQVELEQAKRRGEERAYKIKIIHEARRLRAEKSKKIWARRGLVLAGGVLLGLLLAGVSKAPPQPKAVGLPRPLGRRRRMLQLLSEKEVAKP